MDLRKREFPTKLIKVLFNFKFITARGKKSTRRFFIKNYTVNYIIFYFYKFNKNNKLKEGLKIYKFIFSG